MKLNVYLFIYYIINKMSQSLKHKLIFFLFFKSQQAFI